MNSQFYMPKLQPEHVPILAASTASTLYEHLKEWFADAESELAKDEHLDLSFVTQGGDLISISDIGYHNPHLIVLYGRDEKGDDCKVLVHMAAVQLILKTVKGSETPGHRHIGFVSPVEE
jgi:hypothetical protein